MMYEFGFRCDTGRVRDINQDAFFVIPEKGVFLIADGVGGHNNGELASRTAMTDIAEYIKENPIPVELGAEELKNYFVSLVFAVNRHIYNIARESAPEGMATTLVILFISGGKAYVVNVGDSRLYLLRDENMIQVTEDHTYVNGLVKKGIIDEEQARTHPDRNMITRAVGAEHDVEPDLFLFDVYGGDIILMCTDGLYNELSDSEMHDMVLNSRDMRTACSELVDEANRRGGTDNITAVSVRI